MNRKKCINRKIGRAVKRLFMHICRIRYRRYSPAVEFILPRWQWRKHLQEWGIEVDFLSTTTLRTHESVGVRSRCL